MRKKGSDRRNWSDRWVILSKSGELKYFLPPPTSFPFSSSSACWVFEHARVQFSKVGLFKAVSFASGTTKRLKTQIAKDR
jgi:hypothetical protein